MLKLRWLFYSLCLAMLAGFLNVPKAEAYELDRYCMNSDPSLYDNIQHGQAEYSTSFYPSQNRIQRVSVTVGGFNFSGTAALRISDGSNTTLAADSRSYTNLSAQELWYFEAFPEVTVTPGQKYKIHLSTTTNLYWYKSVTCDVQGNAIANGYTYSGADFAFATWGRTVADPTPTPGGGTTPGGTQTGVTAGSGAAPAAVTSAAIKSPTNLTISDTSANNVPSVKLTWTKSTTTDITGYKVFRSAQEKTGFKEVSKTIKTVTQYTDTSVTASTKYYYFVRAYKGSAESASSNTVNITTAAPNTAVAATPTPTTAAKKKGIMPATLDQSVTVNAWVYYALIFAVMAFVVYYFIQSRRGKKPKVKEIKDSFDK